ncbi:MAG: hypothetical protein COA69_00940 [Robiginitomaculum sp.]|nr:MAG: hypothetical protein COA69_00940 [Robiginitomaculum sp.]
MRLFKFKEKKPNVSRRFDLKAYTGLTYAIGDVHGRCDLLEQLLGIIASDIDAVRGHVSAELVPTIVFLGDYIDRGLQSREVIECLLSLPAVGLNRVFLKGNHEQTALKFLEDPTVGVQWSEHGAIETLVSYGVNVPVQRNDLQAWEDVNRAFAAALPQSHLDFMNSLKPYWIDGPFMFVHAGVDPNMPIDEQTEGEFLWIRDRFIQSRKHLPYIIVHGHTPEIKPVWDGRRIGLDTGAYMTGKLSAVRLFSGEVRFLST